MTSKLNGRSRLEAVAAAEFSKVFSCPRRLFSPELRVLSMKLASCDVSGPQNLGEWLLDICSICASAHYCLCPLHKQHWGSQESNYFSTSGSETELLTFRFLARPLRKVAEMARRPFLQLLRADTKVSTFNSSRVPKGFSCNSMWAVLELEYVNPNGEDSHTWSLNLLRLCEPGRVWRPCTKIVPQIAF
jgi:hypothetical protein